MDQEILSLQRTYKQQSDYQLGGIVGVDASTMFYPLLIEEQKKILDNFKEQYQSIQSVKSLHELIGSTFILLMKCSKDTQPEISYRQLHNILITCASNATR